MDKSSHFIITNIHLSNLLFSVLVCFYLNYAAANENTIGSSNNSSIMCVKEEREALLQFKQDITIDHCGLLSSWGDNQNCCDWSGVRCDNHTSRVTTLDLHGYYVGFCLEGRVSSSIVDLKHLTYLDLSFNNFTYQSIPSFIGSLVKLKHLNLSYSHFKGEISQKLGNLSSLISLDLSGIVSGMYVSELSWLSRLTRLTTLNLRGVDLSRATNWLQIVSKLPFLKVLQLNSCQLPTPTFSWPLSYINSTTTLSYLSLSDNELNDSSIIIIYKWLFNLSGINTHLAHLDLSYNQLGGPFPSAFGNLHSLSYLDLSYNKLQGNIWTSFGNMQALSYLDLSGNSLEGSIPKTIFSNKIHLTHLGLSSNNFQSFPNTLDGLCSLQELFLNNNNLTYELLNIIQSLNRCEYKSLEYLDLSYNQIWGSVPHSIGEFSSLKSLSLAVNKLNGTITERLGQLSMLESLDLSSNFLKGTLSSIHFSNLSRLRYLNLGNNTALTLNIGVNWVPPFQLDRIYLSNCRLGPLFPKWIMTQTNCSYLDLSFNNIEGVIPILASGVNKLKLNNKKFSDPIPFLCQKVKNNLSYMDLSNNLLYVELPDCWMKFPKLEILYLENNMLYGVIPSSFSYLQHLQALHLRNNSINGDMHRSLFENLTSLVFLDLGHNSLSGHIPQEFGNHFRSLVYLSLRDNKFDGVIPVSLCKLSSLQILDLSSNHLIGTIPKCICNFKAMHNATNLLSSLKYDITSDGYFIYNDTATVMWKRKESSFNDTLGLIKAIDLSNNKLEGEIPMEISFLQGLVSLDLSKNNLSGGIMPKIGQLKALQLLDLSNNHFSGEIPSSFIDLNFLSMFNISSNNLSGKIPPGTQLQGFDASVYMRNPGLCGLPLPTCSWDHTLNNTPATNNNTNHHDAKESDDFVLGLCISVVLGFIVGFWGVFGTLVLKRSWRLAFFRSLDDLKCKFCVRVFMIMDRVRRRHRSR